MFITVTTTHRQFLLTDSCGKVNTARTMSDLRFHIRITTFEFMSFLPSRVVASQFVFQFEVQFESQFVFLSFQVQYGRVHSRQYMSVD